MAKTMKVKVTDYSPQFAKYLKTGFKKQVFQNLISSMDALAIAYQTAWINYAYGNATVPGSKTIHSRGNYARSIQIDKRRVFSRIIYTDYPPHKYIEEGSPRVDLKPGLLSGKSARQGKNGPYTIVSFRHFTQTDFHGIQDSIAHRPNVMPVSIQRMMGKASADAKRDMIAGVSSTPGRSTQLTSGPLPENRSYKWGARLDSKLNTGQRSQRYSKYTWATGKYASMTRMESSSGPKENRTQYRTFRVVSWKSPANSWIVPPRDPIPIRQAVLDLVGQHVNVEEMITSALQKDMMP